MIVVSWDVLMVELSNRELESGERDRRAEAGGESCVHKVALLVSLSPTKSGTLVNNTHLLRILASRVRLHNRSHGLLRW